MSRLIAPLLLCIAVGGCSKKEAKPEQEARSKLGSTQASKSPGGETKGSVIVTMTVDWEGAFLSEAGLQAMESFRADWPKMPLTHFICPAYFTQGGDEVELGAKLKSQLHEGDEIALHLHAWFSLAKAAGLTPRKGPNFYADDSPLMSFDHGDQGYEVALDAYEPAELTSLVKSSLQLFEEHKLGVPTAFRAGGYTATPKVLAAVRSAGLTVDSSATWADWFEESQGRFQEELRRRWPNIEELTQPYGIDTSAGVIIEVPNTGSFSEYATADEMLGHLQRALARSQAEDKPIYVDFGFHQETADEYIAAIGDALYNFRSENPGALEFSTVTKVATDVMGQ